LYIHFEKIIYHRSGCCRT